MNLNYKNYNKFKEKIKYKSQDLTNSIFNVKYTYTILTPMSQEKYKPRMSKLIDRKLLGPLAFSIAAHISPFLIETQTPTHISYQHAKHISFILNNPNSSNDSQGPNQNQGSADAIIKKEKNNNSKSEEEKPKLELNQNKTSNNSKSEEEKRKLELNQKEQAIVKKRLHISKLFKPFQEELINKYQHLFNLSIIDREQYLKFTYEYLKYVQAAAHASRLNTEITSEILQSSEEDINKLKDYIEASIINLGGLNKIEKYQRISDIIAQIPYSLSNSNPIDFATNPETGINCDAIEVIASLLVKSSLPNTQLTSKTSVINGIAHVNLVANGINNIDKNFSILDSPAIGAVGGERVQYYLGIFNDPNKDLTKPANHTVSDSLKSDIAISEQLGENVKRNLDEINNNPGGEVNQEDQSRREIQIQSNQDLQILANAISNPDLINHEQIMTIIEKLPDHQTKEFRKSKYTYIKKKTEAMYDKHYLKVYGKETKIMRRALLRAIYYTSKNPNISQEDQKKQIKKEIDRQIFEKYTFFYNHKTNTLKAGKALINKEKLISFFKLETFYTHMLSSTTKAFNRKSNIRIETDTGTENKEILETLEEHTQVRFYNIHPLVTDNLHHTKKLKIYIDRLLPINDKGVPINLSHTYFIDDKTKNIQQLANSFAVIDSEDRNLLNNLTETTEIKMHKYRIDVKEDIKLVNKHNIIPVVHERELKIYGTISDRQRKLCEDVSNNHKKIIINFWGNRDEEKNDYSYLRLLSKLEKATIVIPKSERNKLEGNSNFIDNTSQENIKIVWR